MITFKFHMLLLCNASSDAVHPDMNGNGLQRKSGISRHVRRSLKRDDFSFEKDASNTAAPMLRASSRAYSAENLSNMSSCGDNICDLNENSSTCSEDCSTLAFTPSNTGGNGAFGTMFAVRAIRDLVVTSLNFHAGKKSLDQLVQVYTRKGVFRGFELVEDGWHLIYNKTMDVDKRQVETPLEGGFDAPVNILAGEVQSFFVYTSAKVLYEVGNPDDMLVPRDSHIEFLGGIGKVTKFEGEVASSIAVNRIFRGQLM